MVPIVAMLLLWLGTCAIEVSPELHQLVHKDAHAPGHHCLVTQLQQHSLLPGLAAALTTAAPDVWSVLVIASDFQAPLSRDYRLSPSRAPPAV